jgi:hypothetical protein
MNDQCVRAWRWASRCLTYGTMVYERVESLAAGTSARCDRPKAMPVI